MGYVTIIFHISELHSTEIDRNKAVNRECWKVRVRKDAFEPIVSCYADIHIERERERERERESERES